MSSQQLFKACIHEENLNEKLKAELNDLAADSQKLDYCVSQSFNLL